MIPYKEELDEILTRSHGSKIHLDVSQQVQETKALGFCYKEMRQEVKGFKKRCINCNVINPIKIKAGVKK